jgi:hypothetical protein
MPLKPVVLAATRFFPSQRVLPVLKAAKIRP